MIIPEELFYTKEHEWAKIEDNIASHLNATIS